MVELILLWLLETNSPVFVDERSLPRSEQCRVAGKNCLKAKLTVHVRKDYDNGMFVDLKPYVAVNESVDPQNAGAEAEIGYCKGLFCISGYHHSSHNLDHDGQGVELDGVKLKWRLF